MKVEKITPQIAALHIGRTCTTDIGDGVIDAVYANGRVCIQLDDGIAFRKPNEIIPHIRRIESLTEEEARELYFIKTGRSWVAVYAKTDMVDSCLDYYLNALDYDDIDAIQRLIGEPAVWLYLLGKGIDVLGLIDAGLAKDVGK